MERSCAFHAPTDFAYSRTPNVSSIPRPLIRTTRRRIGKPVLNLDYLLGPVVKTIKPLNWTAFWERQVTGHQPLKVKAQCVRRTGVDTPQLRSAPGLTMHEYNIASLQLSRASANSCLIFPPGHCLDSVIVSVCSLFPWLLEFRS